MLQSMMEQLSLSQQCYLRNTATQLTMSYFYHPHSITSVVPTLQVVYNLVLKPNRAKQDSSVINCTLLALLKKIKGKKVQSSDRLLGQRVDGGLLSAPKGQQEGGGGRR